ncbi:hypothetical protein SAMN02745136_00464 [Anaerocolumna jejuensis DSM 15929]|uniref:Uncharacterized protein n=1 Tax=Anaerocolumna jejuensis DSM 15929 TaxID=1121322 RepID=A0A1M6KID8_9FIRM|nr:hypothetical protein [Anaerocolumna jejuensis]SHJ58694.1 hypothetical protein SAMN02745136_00464 [Anaerocolumna jejuensis DSM 15929]
MVLKSNADKRIYKWIVIIVLAMVLPICVTVNEIPVFVINVLVSICIVSFFTNDRKRKILERAYGYKSEWFEAADMKVIETGKVSRKVAFAIGKEENKELGTQSKYSIIFSKGRKKLTEYNRTFEGSSFSEVSDYLDYVAEQIK